MANKKRKKLGKGHSKSGKTARHEDRPPKPVKTLTFVPVSEVRMPSPGPTESGKLDPELDAALTAAHARVARRSEKSLAAREAMLERLLARHPGLAKVFQESEHWWAGQDLATRVQRKEDLADEVFFADLQITAHLEGRIPSLRPNLSTQPLNQPPDDRLPGQLNGEAPVDVAQLYRAFAVLMDLMNEATTSPFNVAKPAIVSKAARDFIEVMDHFAARRGKDDPLIKATQMLPALVAFYAAAKSSWPAVENPDDIWEGARLPAKLTVKQRRAVDTQHARLSQLVYQFGYRGGEPGLERQTV